MNTITIILSLAVILYGMYKLGHDVGYDKGNTAGWIKGTEWSRWHEKTSKR